VESSQYHLVSGGMTLRADLHETWSRMLTNGGTIKMFVHLPQVWVRRWRFKNLTPENCPRCNAVMPIHSESTSPIRSRYDKSFSCWSCDLDCSTRVTGSRDPKVLAKGDGDTDFFSNLRLFRPSSPREALRMFADELFPRSPPDP